MEASLRDMLRHGRKFERLKIDDAGVFVRKIPKYKDEPAYLAVEINPIGEDGFPINKMGVIIRNQTELDAIRKILSDDKVDEALRAIGKITSA